MRHSNNGFTLLELLVVIAIAAVLTGLAIPSFRSAIQSAQTREAATAFYTALTRARSEAIARNKPVSVCARNVANLSTPTCLTGATSWKDGWIVYEGTPSNTIQLHEPIMDGLTLGSVASPLDFDPSGRVAILTTYTLCPDASRSDKRGRTITISRSGRVSLEPRTC